MFYCCVILRVFSKPAKESQGEAEITWTDLRSLSLIDKALKIIPIFTYDNKDRNTRRQAYLVGRGLAEFYYSHCLELPAHGDNKKQFLLFG